MPAVLSWPVRRLLTIVILSARAALKTQSTSTLGGHMNKNYERVVMRWPHDTRDGRGENSICQQVCWPTKRSGSGLYLEDESRKNAAEAGLQEARNQLRRTTIAICVVRCISIRTTERNAVFQRILWRAPTCWTGTEPGRSSILFFF